MRSLVSDGSALGLKNLTTKEYLKNNGQNKFEN